MATSNAFMLNSNPTSKLFSVSSDSHLSQSSNKSSFGRVTLPDHHKSSIYSSRRSLRASFISPTVFLSMAETSSSLPHMWREIQGSDNWEDLVQPLDPLLRDEIIRYGEFVTACYKAFNLDSTSKRYLNCKYGKKSMLKEVGMENWGYEVTKYIYATPDINIPTQVGSGCSRWVGYVAVSTDDEVKKLGRRDVLVTFRGTVTNSEWIANFMSSLTPARLNPDESLDDVKVESGFLNLYTSDDSSCKFGVGSCREQLLSEISRIVSKYKGENMSITLAGHSMGSSLAVLLAYDIAELGLNKIESKCPNQDIPVTVYSFGGPRVGNCGFKDRCEELGVKVLRIVNINDPVTKLPGVFLNEHFRALGGKYQLPWRFSCYAHLGVELALDFFKMQDLSCVHDLDTYIKLLRCPKMVEGAGGDGVDFLSKLWTSSVFCAQNLDSWQWEFAATNIGNLVQALTII